MCHIKYCTGSNGVILMQSLVCEVLDMQGGEVWPQRILICVAVGLAQSQGNQSL